MEAVGPGPIFIFTLLAAALASLASIEIPLSRGWEIERENENEIEDENEKDNKGDNRDWVNEK